MPYCTVPGCTNCSKKTKGSDIWYHRLPNDQHIRRAWLGRVRRENLPKANSCYVCSVHFTPDCFEGSLKELFGMKGKKALKIWKCSNNISIFTTQTNYHTREHIVQQAFKVPLLHIKTFIIHNGFSEGK